MILRCTKKLVAVLDAGRVADPVPYAEDWYASLLWFDRRKCLLLTHAATLLSAFEADVRAAALRDTHSLVTGLIERELQREDLPPGTFGNLRGQDLVVAKTADRSVLGCMNDMSFLCKVAITGSGGLALATSTNSTRRCTATSTAPAATDPRLNSPRKGSSTATESTGNRGHARPLPGAAPRYRPPPTGFAPEPPFCMPAIT